MRPRSSLGNDCLKSIAHRVSGCQAFFRFFRGIGGRFGDTRPVCRGLSLSSCPHSPVRPQTLLGIPCGIPAFRAGPASRRRSCSRSPIGAGCRPARQSRQCCRGLHRTNPAARPAPRWWGGKSPSAGCIIPIIAAVAARSNPISIQSMVCPPCGRSSGQSQAARAFCAPFSRITFAWAAICCPARFQAFPNRSRLEAAGAPRGAAFRWKFLFAFNTRRDVRILQRMGNCLLFVILSSHLQLLCAQIRVLLPRFPIFSV